MESYLFVLVFCNAALFAGVCSQQSDTTQECSDELSQLRSRLNEMMTEISNLKKLSTATLNVVLATSTDNQDIDTRATDMEPDTSCRSLGTAKYPALSCEQLKEACQVPSGVYYVRGASQTFYKVFCDMETSGGGWTRFGKGNMSSKWNYQNEDEVTTTIDIMSTSDILKIRNLHFTEFRISTDVELWLQADDSVNPSSLGFVPLLPTGPNLGLQGEMKIIGSADHTHLVFDTEGDNIECFSGGGGNKCGTGSLPSLGAKSQRLVILSAFFGPRASGASITHSSHAGQWRRNKYTWKGSYYYLMAK